ncbi:MAG: hypothetical protein KDC14_07405 [Planctomycetes bacterium]|nr:hypothetical protein [Planctomycetota bacterium]
MIARPLWILVAGVAAAILVLRLSEAPADSIALEAPAPVVPEASVLMRLVPGAVYRPSSERKVVAKAAASRESASALHEQLVLVRGPRGESVAAARLESAAARPVFSDADGRARLELALSDEPTRLRVRAAGYCDAVVELARLSDAPIVVDLADGGRLEGIVRWADGAPARANTCVLAWRSARRPGADEVLRVRDGDFSPDLRVARTDALGRFHFDGVDAASELELSAVCEGGLVLRRARGVRAGDAEVELVLEPVVGAALELRDAEGGAPRAGESWFEGIAMWDPSDPRLAPCPLPEGGLELAWLGGSPLQQLVAGGRDRYVMLYRAHDEVPYVRPEGSFSISVPGYEPIWTRFPLEPISDAMTVRELGLVRRTDRFAALEFSLDGVEGWMSARGRADQQAFGLLRLKGVDAHVELEAALRSNPDGRWKLDGVPCGRYELSLALRDWSSVLPGPSAETVIVDVDEDGASAHLSLAGRGAGEILVARADGSDYAGELVLRVKQGDPVRYVRFAAAPYVIGGLEEGEYEVSVERVGAHAAAGAPSAQLWLTADTVSVCMIHLP